MSWKSYLKDIYIQNNFDFVVADFFTFPANILADELGIPNIINCPAPLSVFPFFSVNLP